ncbi:MAG: tyrosine-type recombinase/integrase [Verrucomicrobiales bacterium]|nr:tyrosine-type recombinase/integrase [Verrucomicrobiales bacterium]
MQAKAIPSDSSDQTVRTRQHREAPYQRICDARKHPVRGLWKRNERYYAQITVDDSHTGHKKVKRIPLEGAATDAQAIKKFEDLKAERRKGALPVLKRTPKFSDYADTYLKFYESAKDAKRESTMETERYAIARWKEHLGHVPLDKITRALVNSFIAKRQAQGRTGRTVNLDVTVFRNVMNRAVDDKWINSLPTENLRPLKWTPAKRPLVSAQQIERLGQTALNGDFENGQEFADYLRLLAYCGSRRDETLRLKWSDVDWQNRQLTIGADGLSKNRKSRAVDFNRKLEAHLKEMQTRRTPDSVWLFPSPRRGEGDRPAKTFVETMRLVRAEAGLPKFGFHDCRHYFISMGVMSGIDYMTIARWVGHQDGGILIGRVYGHLSNEHAQRQARRMVFEPELAKDDKKHEPEA